MQLTVFKCGCIRTLCTVNLLALVDDSLYFARLVKQTGVARKLTGSYKKYYFQSGLCLFYYFFALRDM